MRALKTLMLLAICLLPAGVAALDTQPFFNLNTQTDKLVLSYKLEDRDQRFWHSVRDSLRAGEAVTVRHRVEVYHYRPWLWNVRVARVTAPVYVTYNLFEKRFMAGAYDSPHRMKMYFSEEEAESAILGMQHLQIKLDEPLQSGESYRISIEMQMLSRPENRGWQRYLPIEGLFRPYLTQEVEHVAY